jgi:hypothetical protein
MPDASWQKLRIDYTGVKGRVSWNEKSAECDNDSPAATFFAREAIRRNR